MGYWPRVPEALDYISIDSYDWPPELSPGYMRRFYKDFIYPKLHSHQKTWVVFGERAALVPLIVSILWGHQASCSVLCLIGCLPDDAGRAYQRRAPQTRYTQPEQFCGDDGWLCCMVCRGPTYGWVAAVAFRRLGRHQGRSCCSVCVRSQAVASSSGLYQEPAAVEPVLAAGPSSGRCKLRCGQDQYQARNESCHIV